MSTYYAPAFFAYLFGKCLRHQHPVIEVLKLGLVVLGTFALVWYPYLNSVDAFLEVCLRFFITFSPLLFLCSMCFMLSTELNTLLQALEHIYLLHLSADDQSQVSLHFLGKFCLLWLLSGNCMQQTNIFILFYLTYC